MADENTTAAASSPSSGGSNVTSGTASASLIAAAMAAESSPASSTGGATPGTTQPPAGSGATGAVPATTAQAGAGAGVSAQPTETQGPIPFDRHKAILENARKQYEWARDLNPEEVQQSLKLAKAFAKNPQGFYAWLGKRLGQGQTREEQQPKSFPKPRLTAEDGTGAYAADQLPEIVDVIRSQIVNEFRPIIDFTAQLQTERGQAEMDAQNRRVSETALKHARELPQFKENESAVAEKLYGMDRELKNAIGPVAAMYLAYAQVMQEKVLPTYDKTAEQRVREEFVRKANTSRGSVAPNGSEGQQGKLKLNNVDELSAHMSRLAAAAAAT